ncbi:unnamed protein product [Thelazia callipaeda]|uniref:PAS domain-containing protein n=1 Tax=Thelazia callipaeda TaxID=103827 RepID=A0A0N5D578_THECL|nr:unnamed protein product [Thelazia callipaeda]
MVTLCGPLVDMLIDFVHLNRWRMIVKRRHIYRRRETSRYAARDRRGQESDIFDDIRDTIPIVNEATVAQVDRSALLRVASTFCRLREIVKHVLKPSYEEACQYSRFENILLDCLDGFLAIVDDDDTILYISESVSVFLGFTQTDLAGQLFKSFIHIDDYDTYRTCYLKNVNYEVGQTFTIRMKSVISPRGRNLNFKSAQFKPVSCNVRSVSVGYCNVRIILVTTLPAGQGNFVTAFSKNINRYKEIHTTRHNLDMKFIFISHSFDLILSGKSNSLLGTSFYSLVYPTDLQAVVTSVRELFSKGHTKTSYYRLIGANKSVLWVQTEATITSRLKKNQRTSHVFCTHTVIGWHPF